MSVRPFRDIKRRKTKVVNVGKVKIGGDNPISVQSMTNTLTTDIKATIIQINDIAEEGADISLVGGIGRGLVRRRKFMGAEVNTTSNPCMTEIYLHILMLHARRWISAARRGAARG